jgi:Skp family chaperone for outer membrane proteins
MDTEEIIEKIIKWLSDPRGREMFKTIVFLILPIVVLLGLRSAARRKSTEKSSTTIKPRVRPSTHESPSSGESLKETMARERKKVERELQEVFGRQDTVLSRAKKEFDKSTRQKSPRAESPERNEKKMLQEELLKLFSRR